MARRGTSAGVRRARSERLASRQKEESMHRCVFGERSASKGPLTRFRATASVYRIPRPTARTVPKSTVIGAAGMGRPGMCRKASRKGARVVA